MKDLRQNLGEIYREHRGLLIGMILMALAALAFLVFSLVVLSPSSAIVKTGYSDIGSFAGDDLTGMRSAGGYRDGSWGMMLVFPILALVIGVMHNLIAVRLYKRRGEASAKAFLWISFIVLLGGFMVLLRLLGEG